jgi:hypothetical protein
MPSLQDVSTSILQFEKFEGKDNEKEGTPTPTLFPLNPFKGTLPLEYRSRFSASSREGQEKKERES